MANPLIAPPADLTQRAPRGADAGHAPPSSDKPSTPAEGDVTIAATTVEGTTAASVESTTVASKDVATAKGPYAALNRAAGDLLNKTADCVHAAASAPTRSPYADLPNAALSPHDRMTTDPNSGKKGWYAGLRLNVQFSTGPAGVTVGAPEVGPAVASTGKGAAASCVVTSVVHAAINQAARALPGDAGGAIRAVQSLQHTP